MRAFQLLLLSTILSPAAALAAATAAPDDIVVTATGTEQRRDEVGQAITLLDAATIETRQNVNVADLLATTPGVRFSRNGTPGGVTGISLRGAETTQTLVLIDGVKVNDPSGIGDMFDFGSLLVGNIQRIEILRGSNSVAYGSQAIGGVVNLMTGAPTEGFAARASAEYGYSDTFNGKAELSGSSGIAAASAGLSYYRTDGISAASRDFGATERDGYENLAANARLKLSLSEAVNIDLRGYYIDADLDIDSFFGTPEDSSHVTKTRQYIGYAGINAALLDGKLRNRLGVTYYRQNRDTYAARGDDERSYWYRGENKRFEYQGVLEPVDQARLIFGYEHEMPEYSFRYPEFSSSADEKANIDSVYALGLVKPLPGLSLTAGVRHDDHSQFGGETTFGANANWTVAPGTNLRAAYGEGFKAPSLFQLYDVWSGNADLQPERSKSYDIGIDQSLLGGAAELSFTLYRRDTHDQLNYDNDTFRYANLDRTRAKGVELSLALRPTEALNVTASYSYIDAKDRARGSATYGNRLPRRSKHGVSLSADYDWSFGLSTGATITHYGDSYDTITNVQRVDGYAVVDVRARLPLNERIELFGRVDNVFDADYTVTYGYGTFGRSAYAGVRVKLD